MLTIPFVSSLSDDEQTAWRGAFDQTGLDVTLADVAELTQRQRDNAAVAIVANPAPSDLESLPNLRWVHSLWAGVDSLLPAMSERGVGVVRMKDPQLADTMAEAVLTWTLFLHRGLHNYRAQQQRCEWSPIELLLPKQRRIGVLGMGLLGQAAASRLVDAGFSVSGWSRQPKALPGIDVAHGSSGLRSLLERTDIAVVLLPLTSETDGLLGAELFERMPVGASIINFSRGPIVNTKELVSALDSRSLDHAVLDVFDEEPLSWTSELWKHPNVSVTPHVAAPTNKITAAKITVRNLTLWMATGEMPETVDASRGY